MRHQSTLPYAVYVHLKSQTFRDLIFVVDDGLKSQLTLTQKDNCFGQVRQCQSSSGGHVLHPLQPVRISLRFRTRIFLQWKRFGNDRSAAEEDAREDARWHWYRTLISDCTSCFLVLQILVSEYGNFLDQIFVIDRTDPLIDFLLFSSDNPQPLTEFLKNLGQRQDLLDFCLLNLLHKVWKRLHMQARIF